MLSFPGGIIIARSCFLLCFWGCDCAVEEHAVAIIATEKDQSVCVCECRVYFGAIALRVPTRVVRRASTAPRAGRCNLISAGRLGRLAGDLTGYRFVWWRRASAAAALLCAAAAAQVHRTAHTAPRTAVRRYGDSHGRRYFWGTAVCSCAVYVRDCVPDRRRDVTRDCHPGDDYSVSLRREERCRNR